MQSQLYVFLILLLNGLLIGVIFDVFRILRKSFETPDIITYIEDIIFLIFAGLLLIYSTLKFNNGEIRIYLFLGLILGLLLYLLLFSKIFIEISVYIISIIKKLVEVVIVKPVILLIKGIRKMFFKPIVFICLSAKNILSKLKGKLYFFYKKDKRKKDFT